MFEGIPIVTASEVKQIERLNTLIDRAKGDNDKKAVAKYRKQLRDLKEAIINKSNAANREFDRILKGY